MTGDISTNELRAALTMVFAVAAILFVFWPWIVPDRMSRRVRDLTLDQAKARSARSDADRDADAVSWFSAATRFLENLLRKSGLDSLVASKETLWLLRRAGYRDPGGAYVFAASKIIFPFLLFPLVYFYLDLTLGSRLGEYPILFLSVVISSAGWGGPGLFIKNKTIRRQQLILRRWPDTLDLLLLTVEAGMGLETAINKVAHEIRPESPVIADELTHTLADLSYLQNRPLALENLANRTGIPAVREVSTALIQSEKYGVAIGTTLRTLAQESRRARISAAEKKAAALPPRLTVPMIVFFLPVLFIVILTPAVIQIMGLD